MVIEEIKMKLLGREIVVRMGVARRMSSLMVNPLSSARFLRTPSIRLCHVITGLKRGKTWRWEPKQVRTAGSVKVPYCKQQKLPLLSRKEHGAISSPLK